MENENTRTLRLEIPPCSLVSADMINFDIIQPSQNGWQFDPAMPNVPFWTGTIDLSGYAREMKTFYPQAGIIQEGPFWLAFDGSGQTSITLVSSIPLDAVTVATQLGSNGGPGFLDLDPIGTGTGQQNWNTVLFCETQVNMINANLPQMGICQPITNKQSGSLSATASDTLYVLKLVLPMVLANLIGSSLTIPASRILLPGKFGTEPDVEYMMRLKRSVELSQQV